MIGTMHRAGTYPATIKTPLPPAEYSAIRVSFAQDQQELVVKDLGDSGLSIDEETVTVILTQTETLLFRPSAPSPMGEKQGAPAFMQIRCFKDQLDAPASACWRIDVFDAINREVLT